VFGPALRCRGFGSFYGILASSRSPRRTFAFTVAFVQLLIPFLFRHQSLLQPRLLPRCWFRYACHRNHWTFLAISWARRQTHSLQQRVSQRIFRLCQSSLLSAGRIPRLRTNTSPEPAAHSWPPQWIDRLISSAEFRTSAAMLFCTSAKSTALSSPAHGLACTFVLDPAFVGTLTPPEAKSPALDRHSCSGNRTQGPIFYEDLLVLFNGCKLSQATFYDAALYFRRSAACQH
jgi:hypothetical protein